MYELYITIIMMIICHVMVIFYGYFVCVYTRRTQDVVPVHVLLSCSLSIHDAIGMIVVLKPPATVVSLNRFSSD